MFGENIVNAKLLKHIAATLSLIVIVAPCLADFSIDYTGEKTKVKVLQEPQVVAGNSKKLLLDNSIQYVGMQGKCDGEKVFGSGNSVELPSAMRMILPSGWKVFADEGAALDAVLLTWRDGDEWVKVISQTAEKYKFRADISCAEKTLTFHPAPNRGIYSEKESVELADIQQPTSSRANLLSDTGTKATTSTNAVASAVAPAEQSLEPRDRESINAFSERYASAYGYNRVAYKVANISKVINGEIDPKGSRKSKDSFDFSTSLQKQKLYKVDAIDGISGAKVLVITDSISEASSSPLVFNVSKGFLSNNALELARMLGKTIGDTNYWPIDEDYKVPFAYDIVGSTGIDLFLELFKSFPVQAQFVAGQKVIDVVKRDTANRN